MTKKEYCTTRPATAYYSGVGGVEVHGIEYGVNDYIICTAGAWTGRKTYHRLKIRYTARGDAFVTLHGYRLPLNEFIRMGV